MSYFRTNDADDLQRVLARVREALQPADANESNSWSAVMINSASVTLAAHSYWDDEGVLKRGMPLR